jgi:tRNA threonylcarbamoyladenosine biosynthesis protein TsaE
VPVVYLDTDIGRKKGESVKRKALSEKQFITKSFEETEQLGEEFAGQLQPGSVVALIGELGGGKTTFVRGLVRGLGFENRVVSPTFTVMRMYKRKVKSEKSKVKSVVQNSKIERVYHIDLYRMTSREDLKTLDFVDMVQDSQAVMLIEWPELAEGLLPEERMEVRFEHMGEEKRKITISV